MIQAILINPTEAKVSLIEIEDNSILAIAKAICFYPTAHSVNPYHFNNDTGDMIHTNSSLNTNPKDDCFTIKCPNGYPLTIRGNALIVGTKPKEKNKLEFDYTDVILSIADLVGDISFFQTIKTIN